MPTVLRVDGFRFFFYSNDSGEPPHVHVEKGGASGKWWLDPVAMVWEDGFTRPQLRRVDTIIRANQGRLLEAWHEHFPG